MDIFMTGKVPRPDGPVITVRYRPNNRLRYDQGSEYTIPETQLTATSTWFADSVRNAHPSKTIDCTIPAHGLFDIYIRWCQDRIIHRQAVPPGLSRAGMTKEDAELLQDLQHLLHLWPIGSALQDTMFMDVVISILEETVRLPETNIDLFFEACTPEIGTIAANTEPFTKYRHFLVDTIAQFGTTAQITPMLDTESWDPKFVNALKARLALTAPVHMLPTGVKPENPKMLRLLVPVPPYTREMIGEGDRFPKLALQDDGPLSGEQLTSLVRWVVTRPWRRNTRCLYHEHEYPGRCWIIGV